MKNLIKNKKIGILTLFLLLLSFNSVKAEIHAIKATYIGQTVASGNWNNADN